MNEDWKAKRREDYLKKLRDPRWQKMRLEVFQRDSFHCQRCPPSETGEESTDTLHVHHNYYETGKEPWEYPVEAFTTLCETCHEAETANRPEMDKYLIQALKKTGLPYFGVEALAGALETLPVGYLANFYNEYRLTNFAEAIAESPEKLEVLHEVLKFSGLYDIVKSLIDRDYVAFKAMSDHILSHDPSKKDPL